MGIALIVLGRIGAGAGVNWADAGRLPTFPTGGLRYHSEQEANYM